MKIEALRRRLSEDIEPVRRLRPPWARTLIWFAISASTVAAATVWLGTNGRWNLSDLKSLIVLAVTLATALSAALVAFSLIIPGTSRSMIFAPFGLFAVWCFFQAKWSTGGDIVADSQAQQIHANWGYLLSALLMSVGPTAALYFMLRRGAPMAPRATAALGVLAVGALTSLGLRIVYGHHASLGLLAWHFGSIIILMAIAYLTGQRILSWQHHRN